VRLLLTGARGQIGAAVLRAAPAHVEVISFARDQLDIADGAQVLARMRDVRPDVVINTAAYTAVDRAESEPDLARAVNEHGARALAQAAAGTGARLIHLSTDYVFDGEAATPWRPDARTNPLGVYGRTKLAGEQAVLSSAPDRFVVLRTAWVYSPGGQNFVNTMLRLMRERRSVRVVADQIGTPTLAASVADVLWRMVTRPDMHGVYHWTDAGVASWYDFATAIAQESIARGILPADVTVQPITTDEYPTAARRPRFSVLDCSRTVAQAQLSPQHWRVNLGRALEAWHAG
jgi:dTDP-4-dehydrorhamnose reductase